MTAVLNLPLELRPCPIVREESGLALSSRNQLLTPEEKKTAALIYRTLSESKEHSLTHTVKEVHDEVVTRLNACDILEVEYFQIVNADTLQPVSDWDEAEGVVGCITVYCGARPVRLIDNIRYR